MKKLYVLILILIVITVVFYFFNFWGVEYISEENIKLTEVEQSEEGNFAIYVSNQSFDIATVDVKIMIDDKIYISGDFEVRDQHEYVSYRFELVPGSHNIKVESEAGEAMYEGEFEIVDSARAVVEFWYYPETHSNPTPRKFNVSFGPDELLLID